MLVTICIGSSCHIKGAKTVVEELQKLISAHDLGDRVELVGSFCLGNCVKGVSVKIGEQIFSVKPEECRIFFEENILKEVIKK